MAGRSGSGSAAARARGFHPAADRCACRIGAIRLQAHSADEAKSLARDGADQLLIFAVVADRLSRGVDTAAQRRIRYDPAAPDRSDEIVLADEAVAVLHQVNQQVEDLWLDRNELETAAQFAAADIKRMIGKEKLHVAPEPT